MSQGNTTIITALIAALVGGLIGYVLGSGTGSVVPGGRVAELEAQIEQAKRFFPTMPELRTTSGVVKSVSGSTITIDADPSPNPFEAWPKTRDISVGDNTRIVMQEPKDPADYQKEFAAYQKQIERARDAATGAAPAAPGNFPTPPMLFIEREIKPKDIKVGSRISAEAAENIKEATRFEATRILVQPAGAAGVPAGAGVPPAPAPASAPASAPLPTTAPAPAPVPTPAASAPIPNPTAP